MQCSISKRLPVRGLLNPGPVPEFARDQEEYTLQG